MFCARCGSKLPDGARFCGACGGMVAPYAAAPPPPQPPVVPPVPQAVPPTYSPPPVAAPPAAAPHPAARCSWCGSPLDAAATSCPGCGGNVSEMAVSTHSGWTQLPGRKDMAKLQFGQSTCQIEGIYVPVADFNLAAGDSVYFAHHALLWMDAGIAVTKMPLKGAWKRVFAGMPLVMTQAAGPGRIAFSRDAPGELIAVPLHPGQAVDVREHLFLTATGNVVYDWFQTGVWFSTQSGNETETHYPVGIFMDRFTAAGQAGLLLLHAAGNVFVRTLAPGETMLVKPTALIFKDPAVQMHLHIERPQTGFMSWGSWGNRYLWLRVVGPGRVGVQSVFEHLHGEALSMQGHSYATEMRW